MSVDKSLRGVSCVECRFCFFDESLESSFSDSEVGIFFFQLFGKSNQVAFRSGGKSTRVVRTGGSRAGVRLVPCVSADISCRVSFTMIL